MVSYDELAIEFNEDDFERVLEELREYLSCKGKGSIQDYIIAFCEKFSYRIEAVGEVIGTDKELKDLLRQDCIRYGIFRTDDNRLDEW